MPASGGEHDELIARGNRALDEQQLAAALEAFREARALAPERPEGAHGLGRVALESGRADHACSLLEKALALAEAAHLLPLAADVRRDLGHAYLAADRLLEAIESWNASLAIRPDGDVERARDDGVDLLLASAREMAAAGDLDSAIRLSRMATRARAAHAPALALRGLVEAMGGLTFDAEASLRACLALDPRNVEARATLEAIERLAAAADDEDDEPQEDLLDQIDFDVKDRDQDQQ